MINLSWKFKRLVGWNNKVIRFESGDVLVMYWNNSNVNGPIVHWIFWGFGTRSLRVRYRQLVVLGTELQMNLVLTYWGHWQAHMGQCTFTINCSHTLMHKLNKIYTCINFMIIFHVWCRCFGNAIFTFTPIKRLLSISRGFMLGGISRRHVRRHEVLWGSSCRWWLDLAVPCHHLDWGYSHGLGMLLSVCCFTK